MNCIAYVCTYGSVRFVNIFLFRAFSSWVSEIPHRFRDKDKKKYANTMQKNPLFYGARRNVRNGGEIFIGFRGAVRKRKGCKNAAVLLARHVGPNINQSELTAQLYNILQKDINHFCAPMFVDNLCLSYPQRVDTASSLLSQTQIFIFSL